MLDNHDESFFLYKQKLIVLSKSNTIKCHVRNRYVVWFYAIGKNRIDTERQRKPCRKDQPFLYSGRGQYQIHVQQWCNGERPRNRRNELYTGFG